MGSPERDADVYNVPVTLSGLETSLHIRVEHRKIYGPKGDLAADGSHLGLWVGAHQGRLEGEPYSWVNVSGPNGYIEAYAVWRGELCVALPCYTPWSELARVVARTLGVTVREATCTASGMEAPA